MLCALTCVSPAGDIIYHLFTTNNTTTLSDYEDLEGNPGAYNSGGQQTIQERAIELTDPDLLAEYGDGSYPLRWVYDKGGDGLDLLRIYSCSSCPCAGAHD